MLHLFVLMAQKIQNRKQAGRKREAKYGAMEKEEQCNPNKKTTHDYAA
jgi:hypothetical protein